MNKETSVNKNKINASLLAPDKNAKLETEITITIKISPVNMCVTKVIAPKIILNKAQPIFLELRYETAHSNPKRNKAYEKNKKN